MTLIREINFTPAPTMFGFSTDINRQYGENKIRNITGFSDVFVPVNYNKLFTWTRSYNLRWDLTKNLKVDFAADNMANILEPYGKIDTEAKRDSVWDNVRGFGTTMAYHHTMNSSFNIPLNKIPAFDWITPSVRYSTGFTWQRAPLAADSVGNVLGNNAKWDYTAQLNMTTLYNKVPYFKKINQKRPGQPAAPSRATGRPPTQTAAQDTTKKEKEQYSILEYMARLVMSVRTISGTYSENSTQALPGYNRRTQILGFDPDFSGPGAGFLFGQQKSFGPNNLEYPMYAREKGWLVTTASLYTPYTQGTTKNLTLRATLEPFPDVRIELTANRTYSKNTSYFYRYEPTVNDYQEQSRTETGAFSMTIISWRTSFKKENKEDHMSEVFEQFLNNRATISRRLGNENPNSLGILPTGYFEGYSDVQQDVLIPAFMAAYTGKRAETVSTSLFPAIPLPNWRITYDGLTKYEKVKKYFKTVAVSHSYRSTYSLGGFSTNLNYTDADGDGFTYVRNVVDDFQSAYLISTVQISEQFSPLISFDMTWASNNNLSTRIEYKKDRTLSLSLANTQLTEISGRELVVGAGYRIPKLPIKMLKKMLKKVPTSDLNIRADVSYRNNQTVIRKAVEDINVLTAGQNIFSIKTSIDYQLTTQLQVRFFFDRIMTNPLISSSFKTANTKAGISLRFMLQ
jgi:cell surface protein SprA